MARMFGCESEATARASCSKRRRASGLLVRSFARILIATAEPGVSRAVDLPHPASAQRREDFVLAKLRTWRKTHWIGDLRSRMIAATIKPIAADAVTSDVQCRKASTRDSATANARITAITLSDFDSALKIRTPARANA